MTDPFEKSVVRDPDERALSAIAQAVRRARQLSQGSEEPEQRAPGPAVAPVDPGPEVRAPAPFAETVLRASVVVVGALVLGLGSAAVTLQLSGHTAPPTVPVQAGRVAHPTPAGGARGPSTRSGRPTEAAGRPAPSRPPVGTVAQAAPPGSAPELLSVSPTVGQAGQVVTVSGVNLFSADGTVQALVGGKAAPTRCPTQTACTVTVPGGMGPTGSLPIMIETEAGTSNALPFSYG